MITATLVLSGTSRLGTPPIASNALVWAPIQSLSAWVQLASASQRAVLAPQLPMDRGEIGLSATRCLACANRPKELRFEHTVAHLGRRRPAEPGCDEPLQRQPDGRGHHADPAGDLLAGHTGGIQPKQVANGAKSSRNAERDQIGMIGDIIPESRATSVGSRTHRVCDVENAEGLWRDQITINFTQM